MSLQRSSFIYDNKMKLQKIIILCNDFCRDLYSFSFNLTNIACLRKFLFKLIIVFIQYVQIMFFPITHWQPKILTLQMEVIFWTILTSFEESNIFGPVEVLAKFNICLEVLTPGAPIITFGPWSSDLNIDPIYQFNKVLTTVNTKRANSNILNFRILKKFRHCRTLLKQGTYF